MWKDSYPVSVSSEHVERKERRDPLTKPTKNPKPNKNQDHELERGDPFCSDIPEWLHLVSRCSERTLDVLVSIAFESLGKTRNESQTALSPQTEQHYRTVRPVLVADSSSYSEWNADKNLSSQQWKSDELMEARTGRPVVNRTAHGQIYC